MPQWLHVLLTMSGIWTMLTFVIVAIIYERVKLRPYRGRIVALSTELRDRQRIRKNTYILVAFGFFAGGVGAFVRMPPDFMMYVVITLYLVVALTFASFAHGASRQELFWDEVVKGDRERPAT